MKYLSYVNSTDLFLFIVIVLSLFLSLPTQAASHSVNENLYADVISHAAKRHSVSPNLIRAVIWQESRFKKTAVGEAGEVGLMQIMTPAVTDWAKAYKVRVPTKRLLFDPSVNIEIGTWYLSRALRRWHNYKYAEALALCEYNAGRRGMKNWIPKSLDGSVDIKLKLTYNYVTRILKKYVQYCAESEPQTKIAYTASRRR